MNNPISRWWKGLPAEPKKATVGIISTAYTRQTKRIVPTYEEMIDRYLSESRIKCAIDELADVSVGVGFHTTCAKGFDDALDIVNTFCEDVNLDGLNSEIAKDVYITGNGLLWRKTPAKLEDLLRVPIYSITKLRSDGRGNLAELEQKFQGEISANIKGTEVKQFYHIRQNPIDTGILGRGLLEPYVRQGVGYPYKTAADEWKTAYRPSLAEINEEIEDMMRTALTRYSPKFAMELGNFSEDEATELSTKLKTSSWVDDLIVWYKGNPNERKFFPHRLSTDPRSRLDPFIEHFVDKELVTTQTPSVKLISKEGFTEASSRTAEAIEMRKVSAFQRFYKRILEQEVFIPVLMTQKGWTRDKAAEAQVRLHWGPTTKPEVNMMSLIEMVKSGIITAIEARKNVGEAGVILIEGEENNLKSIYGLGNDMNKLKEKKPGVEA